MTQSLYSSNYTCFKETEVHPFIESSGLRMLEDSEPVRTDDVIWSNESSFFLDIACAPSLPSLLYDSNLSYCWIGSCIPHGLVDRHGERADEFLDKITKTGWFKDSASSLELNKLETKSTFSIWRRKIRLNKREWQTRPLPIP